MTALVPAIGGALVVVGIIGVIVGVIPQPERPAAPRRRSPLSRLRFSRRSRLLLGAGVIAGAIVAIVTGWLLAIVIAPLAAVGLPFLLSASDAQDRIARLEAMEEWIRSLSGVLTAGVGLEQALIATLRSAPA